MDARLPELQRREVLRTRRIEQVGREDNLVEQVPRAAILQRARALLDEHVIPWVVHVLRSHLHLLSLSREALAHAVVGGVVVHVAHHHHLHGGVERQERVFHGAHLCGTPFAVARTAESAWQVAHDEGHWLAGQLARHGEEAAGVEGAVFGLAHHVGHQALGLFCEQLRIIEQGAVDAAAVGSLDVGKGIATLGQGLLLHKVFEHAAILHLAQSNDGASHMWQHVGAHVGQCARHVAQLVAIFQPIPFVGAAGQKVVIFFAGIVAGVKQIFLVVEAHGIDACLLLRCGNHGDAPCEEQKKRFLHCCYLD